MKISPSEGVISPINIARNVVFPAPFFPKTPKIPPYGKLIETLLTTVLLSYVFDKFFVLIDVFGT